MISCCDNSSGASPIIKAAVKESLDGYVVLCVDAVFSERMSDVGSGTEAGLHPARQLIKCIHMYTYSI